MKRALLILVLVACKPAPSAADAAPATKGDPPTACTQLGAPCTVAPGKLGTCVEIEKTTGEYQFTCQSQH
jgi:hypothetical protein